MRRCMNSSGDMRLGFGRPSAGQQLCGYLGCELSALLEYVPDEPGAPPKRLGPRRSA